jgi:hypothetical protein
LSLTQVNTTRRRSWPTAELVKEISAYPGTYLWSRWKNAAAKRFWESAGSIEVFKLVFDHARKWGKVN